MRADLHIHTRYSDGSYTVREALLLARERGLDVVAFTDHDTTEGTAEALQLAGPIGVTVVPAVEISASTSGPSSGLSSGPATIRRVHILGYGFRLPATHIDDLCRPLLERRHANTLRQIQVLAGAGYPVTEDAVRLVAMGGRPAASPAPAQGPGSGPLGALLPTEELPAYDPAAPLGSAANPVLYKQHIMRILIDEGLADGFYGDTYTRLFKGSGPAAGDIEYVSMADAVQAILADGGLPVLAHPGQLDSYDLIDELVRSGLAGIELYHEDHCAADHRRVQAATAAYGLFTTGGSDDHGSLGSVHVMGEIAAPAGVAERLTRVGIEELDRLAELLRSLRSDLLRAAVLGVPAALKQGDIRDLLTEFDVGTERRLIDELSRLYPADGFVTEEDLPAAPAAPTGRPGSDGQAEVGVWIIDPIDGTTNFASIGSHFAISIARYVGFEPQLGLVYDVVDDELFLAAAGEGAWVNGRRLRLNPAGQARIADAIVDISMTAAARLRDDYGADLDVLVEKVRAQRSQGSAALGLCGLAAGRSQVYLAGNVAVWDYAAARIVIEEAGGAFLIGRGGRADSATGRFTRAKHPVLAATSPELAVSMSAALFPGGAPWD